MTSFVLDLSLTKPSHPCANVLPPFRKALHPTRHLLYVSLRLRKFLPSRCSAAPSTTALNVDALMDIEHELKDPPIQCPLPPVPSLLLVLNPLPLNWTIVRTQLLPRCCRSDTLSWPLSLCRVSLPLVLVLTVLTWARVTWHLSLLLRCRCLRKRPPRKLLSPISRVPIVPVPRGLIRTLAPLERTAWVTLSHLSFVPPLLVSYALSRPPPTPTNLLCTPTSPLPLLRDPLRSLFCSLWTWSLVFPTTLLHPSILLLTCVSAFGAPLN